MSASGRTGRYQDQGEPLGERTALFAALTEPASGLRLTVTILSQDESARIDRPPRRDGFPSRSLPGAGAVTMTGHCTDRSLPVVSRNPSSSTRSCAARGDHGGDASG